LLVDVVFDRGSGTVTVTDRDNGATASASAFSGNGPYANDPAYEAMKDSGPLPGGNYDILNHPIKDWFSLDKADGTRDDYDPITKRGKFRFHSGTASDGCVTVTDDRSPLDYHGNPNGNLAPGSSNMGNWDKIRDILNKTTTYPVNDASGRSRPYYGNLHVQ
jgi:hypothetical protein